MIKIQDFLTQHNFDIGSYALVTYNNKTEPVWFTRYLFEDGEWFLESPCQLYRICEIEGSVDKFAKMYISELLEKNEDEKEYIDTYIKPMIINNVLYSIENFQCSPYLPEYVDDIKLISNRHCLEYMLNSQ